MKELCQGLLAYEARTSECAYSGFVHQQMAWFVLFCFVLWLPLCPLQRSSNHGDLAAAQWEQRLRYWNIKWGVRLVLRKCLRFPWGTPGARLLTLVPLSIYAQKRLLVVLHLVTWHRGRQEHFWSVCIHRVGCFFMYRAATCNSAVAYVYFSKSKQVHERSARDTAIGGA